MKLRSALSLLILTASTLPLTASMFDTDYQPSTYNWAPFRAYSLGGNQQTDAFRDLTWYTHGDQNPANYNATFTANFTSPGGVTLAGGTIGSYIKWGAQGSGTMPPAALLGAIQSGTVTSALLAANPITPKAIDAPRLFSLSSTTPEEGLQSIVLQLRTGTVFPTSPDASPFEMAQMIAPVVLSLNNGTLFLDWDFRELTHLSSDTFSAAYTQEVWSFQWDLSGISVPITEFSIQWDSHPFGNLFGAQIDQSTAYSQVVDIQAVPEPSSWALVAIGVGLVLFKSRKRRLA